MSHIDLKSNEEVCITAILPLYDCEDAVEDAVEEILQQEYDHWKLILVDDGSCDATAEICTSYAEDDERIIFIRNEEQMGSAYCYQKGSEAAEEGYILFLDPTDGLEPEAFATIAAAAKRQTADVITFGIAALQYTLEGELRQEVEHAIPTRFWRADSADAVQGMETGANAWNETISELAEQELLDPYWNKAYNASFMKKNNLVMTPETWENESLWTEAVLGKAASFTVLGDILYDRIFWYTEEDL